MQTVDMCDQLITEIQELEKHKEEAMYLKALNLTKLGKNEEAHQSLDALMPMINDDIDKLADCHYMRASLLNN